MGKYIIRNGNNFSVEDRENEPVNKVMIRYDMYGFKSRYSLVNTSVNFEWEGGSNGELLIFFNNVIIDSYKTEDVQQVCDFLTKYNSMTKKDIEQLYLERQTQTKSALEQEIDSLKQEKTNLEEEITIYRKIKQKQEEINELISQLETKTENKN